MLSVSTTYDCSHHSSCIHCQAKPSYVGPCHFPRCWGKKPKTTTKVTLTSHQSTHVMSSKFFLKNTFPSRSVNNPLSHPIGHSVEPGSQGSGLPKQLQNCQRGFLIEERFVQTVNQQVADTNRNRPNTIYYQQ